MPTHPDLFRFQQFAVRHGPGALKVTTDACFLGALINPADARHMADMGAGTGLLSLMVAQRAAQQATIHAVENNLEAFGYLVENVAQSPYREHIQTHPADVLRFADAHAGQMDLVFANPPFFRGIRRQADEGLNAALHMPPGLPASWTEGAARLLRQGGRLYIMWTPDMAGEWIALAAALGLGLRSHWQLAHAEGHQPIRSVFFVEKGHLPSVQPEVIRIFVRQKESDQWSEDFRQLMRGYYLGLH